ncbi:protein Shroom2-like isoform X1 [Dasypus novemcinctus]|uniref:protein Shroom2-like isoform X1 n=1 Tax=Dasypus novemcinctus TaxID=9361 RepID=UPI0026605547|nr:protein Shroom2-like isoform X1 [Dasypus novemcinctus]
MPVPRRTCPSRGTRQPCSAPRVISAPWAASTAWTSPAGPPPRDASRPPSPTAASTALGGPSRRDSAYGSFSTSSSTPDPTVPRADASCLDSALHQTGLGEGAGSGAAGLEERLEGRAPAVHHEPPRSPGQDDLEPRPPPPGRPMLGPVWYVPDKKKSPSSPPPPPPPLRRDSFAATMGPPFPEAAGTHPLPVLARGDWRPELWEPQQRLTPRDGRRAGGPGCGAGPRLHGPPGSFGRLQASLSSTDVSLAPSSHGAQHPRQCSDEGPWHAAPRGEPWHPPPSWGQQEPATTWPQGSSPTQLRWLGAGAGVPEPSAQSRYCAATRKPDLAGAPAAQLGEYWKCGPGAAAPGSQEGPKLRCRLPQPVETLDARERGRGCPPDRREEAWSTGLGEPQGACPVEKAAQRKVPEDLRWVDGASSSISAQKTPLLHCLTQEGRSRPDGGAEKPLPVEAQAGKQARRSDRFATTLRNEIQLRRARLQKSRSSVSLPGAQAADEEPGGCLEGAAPGGSCSSTYKAHLQEAQARVLRATSFKRRDLDPSPAGRAPGGGPAAAQGWGGPGGQALLGRGGRAARFPRRGPPALHRGAEAEVLLRAGEAERGGAPWGPPSSPAPRHARGGGGHLRRQVQVFRGDQQTRPPENSPLGAPQGAPRQTAAGWAGP